MATLKHPETMSREELNAHLNSLSDEELELTMEAYAHRWRAFNNGFSRHQDDQAFLNTGRSIQNHYVTRYGLVS